MGAAPRSYSLPRTNEVVLDVVRRGLRDGDSVLDFGAGEGYLTDRMKRDFTARGLAVRLSACDARPENYVLVDPPCDRTGTDLVLPYPDGSFDAAVAVEVLEHVESAYGLLRSIRRVLRPGGRLVLTTPNVLSVNSRVRAFLYGFAEMFDVLPLETSDPVHFGGHISPTPLYYACHAAIRCGFEIVSFRIDRSKRSAAVTAVFLWPLLKLAEVPYRRRLRRKIPRELRENRRYLEWNNSWAVLTGRTIVLELRRTEAEMDPGGSVVPSPDR
jgi:SAM-dependent methyltransferase